MENKIFGNVDPDAAFVTWTIEDSGEREEFATGAVRDTREGKGRYDLLSAIAIHRLAQHTEAGARKYSERNWEKGQPVSRYIDSGMRHLFAYLMGKRNEDHLAAAMWNCMAAIHTVECCRLGLLPAHLNDLHERSVHDGNRESATSDEGEGLLLRDAKPTFAGSTACDGRGCCHRA